MKFKVGDYVNYDCGYKQEVGRIKAIREDNTIFVVYNCAGDWENYQDYTGVNTDIKYLTLNTDNDRFDQTLEESI